MSVTTAQIDLTRAPGSLELTEEAPCLHTARPGLAPDDAERWQATIRDFYDRTGPCRREGWKYYYYERIKKRLAGIVEPGSRVLDIGCGDGGLLASLKPAVGVGIDLSGRSIAEARKRHPQLRFSQMRGEDLRRFGDTFDYVIIFQTLGEIYDLRTLLESLQSVCHARTRLLIVHYSRVWQPILKLMEWLRIKRPAPEQNWLPTDELAHLLSLGGFETVDVVGLTIAPAYIPLVSGFLNRVVANLPGIHHFALNFITVARSVRREVLARNEPRSVSIVVPARNESGHIKPLLDRIPEFAPKQEVIFVEGNSTDDTWDTIQEVSADYDGPLTVKCVQQNGGGKGDAVRKGFALASGDVLMILDADLSVPPEELPGFYQALVSGRGEFINGSRMVYLMDRRAMRFLNLLGNKLFGWLFTYLLSQRFRDTLCGTKVLKRVDYERIAANRSYFGDFDPFGDFDLLFGAARLNLKIIDMPVHYKARTYGETNISRFRHGWTLLRMCVFAARRIKFI
ncbi:MAG: glycosyltransferase [Phycisphaerales bacterium]|nr:MAG: glycosyltransferase [Phycisphaerales bacterium]